MKITYGKELIMDMHGCDVSKFTEANIRKYLKELCVLIDMKRYGDPVFWHDYSETPHLKGVSVMQFISTSDIVIHALDLLQTVLINIFSCKDFDIKLATDFSKKFFGATQVDFKMIERRVKAYDNPKVKIVDNHKHGKAVFAKEKIFAGENIAVFDGKIYTAKKASLLSKAPKDPNDPRDHTIQFAKDQYRVSKGLAKYLNHSCNPNCGIKDKFKIVAMKDIKKGEELTWDYDMSENSDWTMKCTCGSKKCRKNIKGFRNLPKNIRIKYKGFISDWLIE
jgi:S-adenosylmethionine/arginine decarboxylase-like enzyme